jgi:transposase
MMPPSGVRVWLAAGVTDMRRGMNGLAPQVQQSLRRDPHICVGPNYVAAASDSADLGGDSGFRRHIIF